MAHPYAVRHGCLASLSVSGAFIRGDYDLRPLARVLVAIDLPPWSTPDAATLAAFVARRYKDGIGIEWCEFAPPHVGKLLQSVTARRYLRPGGPERNPSATMSRVSPPLLKHPY